MSEDLPGEDPDDDLGTFDEGVVPDDDDGYVGSGVRRGAVAVIVVAFVAAMALLGLLVSALGGGDDAETYVIEIPAGTADRQAAGEDLELIPAELELHVGDTLRIVNKDDSYQTLGPYEVAPYQTLVQRFTQPGEIQGSCSLHPSGQVKIVITA